MRKLIMICLETAVWNYFPVAFLETMKNRRICREEVPAFGLVKGSLAAVTGCIPTHLLPAEVRRCQQGLGDVKPTTL